MNTSLTPQPVATEANPTAAQADTAVAETVVTAVAETADTTVAESAVAAAPSAVPSSAPSATPSATQAQAQAQAQTPRALLKQLQTQFPAFRDFLPLSIGIDKQILAQLPELNRKTMRTALGIHTGSLRYLKVMEKAKLRYDLDGSAGAEVTDTHRSHATQVLQERFKKEAERKKAERDAAREATAAEEAARVHAEKLSQLTAKFSRKA